MIKVLIPIIPVKFEVISNAFLVETWFYLLLGGFFYHFTWFHLLLITYHFFLPSLVIKWFHWLNQHVSNNGHQSKHRSHANMQILLTCCHFCQQFSLFHLHHLLYHLLFRAVILCMKGFIYYLILQEILCSSEDVIYPHLLLDTDLINIDSDLLKDDLLLASGLFAASSSPCCMAGYDLSGVIASSQQSILFDTGDSFPLIFDTGTS